VAYSIPKLSLSVTIPSELPRALMRPDWASVFELPLVLLLSELFVLRLFELVAVVAAVLVS
jgi:hypothetical protein